MGEGGTGDAFGAVDDFASSLTDQISSWAESFIPTLAGVAVAFMAFWLIRLVVRLVKSFASSR